MAHPNTWQYAGSSAHGLHNLNYFSCFRDSAQLLAREFERSVNGFTINQLYFITPPLLSAVLPPGFVLDVPGVGRLNQTTLFEEIERISSFAAIDVTNPKKQLADIFTALVRALPSILQARSGLELLRVVLTKITTPRSAVLVPKRSLTKSVFESGSALEPSLPGFVPPHDFIRAQ